MKLFTMPIGCMSELSTYSLYIDKIIKFVLYPVTILSKCLNDYNAQMTYVCRLRNHIILVSRVSIDKRYILDYMRVCVTPYHNTPYFGATKFHANVCVVVRVVVCCLFLTSGCCLLWCDVM